MKLILFSVVSFLTLSACSHIQYVDSDKVQNTVSLQGGRYDTEDGIEVAAQKYCSKPYFYTMETTTAPIDYPNSGDYWSSTKAPQYIYTFRCESTPRTQN
jgi:hypothetical protein